jgi:hypothetical protein
MYFRFSLLTQCRLSGLVSFCFIASACSFKDIKACLHFSADTFTHIAALPRHRFTAKAISRLGAKPLSRFGANQDFLDRAAEASM